MAKKFKVNAPVVNLLKSDGTSINLEKNNTGNVDDYNSDMLIVLSNNGIKGKDGEYIYLPSLTIDADVTLTPEVPALDAEASMKAGTTINKVKIEK
jgi:hypothetical protein